MQYALIKLNVYRNLCLQVALSDLVKIAEENNDENINAYITPIDGCNSYRPLTNFKRKDILLEFLDILCYPGAVIKQIDISINVKFRELYCLNQVGRLEARGQNVKFFSGFQITRFIGFISKLFDFLAFSDPPNSNYLLPYYRVIRRFFQSHIFYNYRILDQDGNYIAQLSQVYVIVSYIFLTLKNQILVIGVVGMLV